MTGSIKFSRAIELQLLFAVVSVIRVYCFAFTGSLNVCDEEYPVWPGTLAHRVLNLNLRSNNVSMVIN